MPVVHQAIEHLTDDPMVFALTQIPRFSELEESVLSKPVPQDEIRIKPTGQIYLSHTTYTRWFNEAFGRGQWGLQQLQKAQKVENNILITYAFWLRGQALFTAIGEAEYHPTNREQTFGDVIESTHAYALRRLAKRLGVGIEMWDKPFVERWIRDHAVRVETSKDGSVKKVWRLKSDPPFWNEVDSRKERQQQRQQGSHQPARGHSVAASNPKAEEPITNDQVIRMWTIARKVGRSDDEIKRFLADDYSYTSSKAIRRKHYENIVSAIEKDGPLRKVIDVGGDKPMTDGEMEDAIAAAHARRVLEREPGEDDQ